MSQITYKSKDQPDIVDPQTLVNRCVICKSELDPVNAVYCSHCNNGFCKRDIGISLSRSKKCPVCRLNFASDQLPSMDENRILANITLGLARHSEIRSLLQHIVIRKKGRFGSGRVPLSRYQKIYEYIDNGRMSFPLFVILFLGIYIRTEELMGALVFALILGPFINFLLRKLQIIVTPFLVDDWKTTLVLKYKGRNQLQITDRSVVETALLELYNPSDPVSVFFQWRPHAIHIDLAGPLYLINREAARMRTTLKKAQRVMRRI